MLSSVTFPIKSYRVDFPGGAANEYAYSFKSSDVIGNVTIVGLCSTTPNSFFFSRLIWKIK
jgi:hypothetical protein